MQSRYTKALLSLAAAAALAVPASALARQGADDGARHVRQEHRDVAHHVRQEDRRVANHLRRVSDDRGKDGRGADDGPNHR